MFPHLDLIINEVSSTICFSSNEDYPIFISSNFIENNYNHRYTEYLENSFTNALEFDERKFVNELAIIVSKFIPIKS